MTQTIYNPYLPNVSFLYENGYHDLVFLEYCSISTDAPTLFASVAMLGFNIDLTTLAGDEDIYITIDELDIRHKLADMSDRKVSEGVSEAIIDYGTIIDNLLTTFENNLVEVGLEYVTTEQFKWDRPFEDEVEEHGVYYTYMKEGVEVSELATEDDLSEIFKESAISVMREFTATGELLSGQQDSEERGS